MAETDSSVRDDLERPAVHGPELGEVGKGCGVRFRKARNMSLGHGVGVLALLAVENLGQ